MLFQPNWRRAFIVLPAFACLAIGIAHPAHADIINVPGDYPTIQEAIAAAEAGDEIIVAEGSYFENIDLLGKAITVRSTNPEDPEVVADTLIHGWDLASVVTCNSGEGQKTVLSGFTITQGHAEKGGGLYNDGGSPMITHCVFTSNVADESGGAMYNHGGSPVVIDCSFNGNDARYGAGMRNDMSEVSLTHCTFAYNDAVKSGGGIYNDQNSTLAMTGCTFRENSAEEDGGAVHLRLGASLTAVNCAFSGNSAGDRGGGIYNGSCALSAVNCTFAANHSPDGGGLCNYDSNPTLTNCIFWDNQNAQIKNHGSSEPIVTYCDVDGGYPGEGNMDVNPRFVDASSGDVRLLCFSPCVDAGNNDAVPDGITTDLEGNPRFVDDAGVIDSGQGTPPIVDMGACERQSESIVNTWTVPGDFESIQQAIGSCDHCDEIIVAPGTYSEAIDFLGKAIHLRSSDGPEVTIIDAGGLDTSVVTFVTDEAPGTTLEGFTITGGTGTLVNGDRLGGGIYCNRSEPSIVDCVLAENSARDGGGMYNERSSPVLTGCTFVDNSADSYGGGLYTGLAESMLVDCTFEGNMAFAGGGMRVEHSLDSGTMLLNCTFNNNVAHVGGGMELNYARAILAGCTFDWNIATASGGGIQLSTNAQLLAYACTFVSNLANASGGGICDGGAPECSVVDCRFVANLAGNGGAMANWNAEPTVINCTMSGNLASSWGAVLYNSEFSHPTVANCIMWANTDPGETCIYCTDDSSADVTYTCIEGGYAGQGNIDADPLFTRVPDPGPDGYWGTDDDDLGDLHLLPGSPCIDAGDNTAVPPDEHDLDEDGDTEEPIPFDLEGNPRFVDDPDTEDTGFGDPPIVDMGAYEFQALECPADFDGDGDVDAADLLHLLGAWGTPNGDVDGNGDTDAADLLALLAAWGECP